MVLFTLGIPELNAVYNAVADVLHVPRELEVMARGWESLNAKAEVARVHRDGHCLEAMMWNRPLEDFGRWQIHAGRDLPKGDDHEPIIERGLTQISRAGNPKRPLPDCQAGPTASSTPLFRDAQKPWWAPLVGQAR